MKLAVLGAEELKEINPLRGTWSTGAHMENVAVSTTQRARDLFLSRQEVLLITQGLSWRAWVVRTEGRLRTEPCAARPGVHGQAWQPLRHSFQKNTQT